jgi:hypothetical protein
MRTIITSTAVALSAAALTLGTAGAASAEMYQVDDPQDTPHGFDVRAITIKNGNSNLRVTTDHENLRRDFRSGSGGLLYVDTDAEDRGPEYVFAAGYFEGTDYTLMETEGFGHKRFGDPVEHGDYIMKVGYRKDRVRVIMSRHAIGDPTDVRIAYRSSGTRTDGTSDGLVDWVGEPRSFTPWIAQG